MKAIPTSVKAQFFAMYYNQPVFRWVENIQDPTVLNGGLLDMIIGGQFDDSILQLRDSSDLTDEEAMQVAKLFDLSEEQIADTDLIEWIEALFTETAGYYIDGYTGSQLLYTIDYLRSIGILISFTYLNKDKKPVTLSVDELIGMKWAVIKK